MCFRSMFAAASSSDGMPEVQMAEDSVSLELILPYCYPIRTSPAFADWTNAKLRKLYEVADKLDILRAMDAIVFVLLHELDYIDLSQTCVDALSAERISPRSLGRTIVLHASMI